MVAEKCLSKPLTLQERISRPYGSATQKKLSLLPNYFWRREFIDAGFPLFFFLLCGGYGRRRRRRRRSRRKGKQRWRFCWQERGGEGRNRGEREGRLQRRLDSCSPSTLPPSFHLSLSFLPPLSDPRIGRGGGGGGGGGGSDEGDGSPN